MSFENSKQQDNHYPHLTGLGIVAAALVSIVSLGALIYFLVVSVP